MRSATITALLLSSLGGLNAAIVAPRANGVAAVDLAKSTGPANFLASGWIYGFPNNGIEADSSIPEHVIRDLKFGANRAGGAQTPTLGWYDGYQAYIPRLNSTLSNYRTTRKYGGAFILLVHDLWGADGKSISLYPGDNGDWTQTDAFLQQLANDIRANNILEGLVIDIWNEPDLTAFWDRSWEQFLAYYVRAHHFFRSQFPTIVISGPSTAASPSLNDSKWRTWFSTIANEKTVPDIYSWHQIGTWSRQPDTTVPDLNTLKGVHNLPDLPIHVNEYATKDEQTPACSVYYIAQLERHNVRGLRAHWGSTNGLHDDISNLIFKDAAGTYHPTGEWQLYKYYAAMEGDRVATTASSDLIFDVYATRSENGAKIIAGTRNVQAPYDITVTGLASLGLPEVGSVNVQAYQFNYAGDQAEVGEPIDLGTTAFIIASGSITISVNPATRATAYAYEISRA